MLEPVLFCSLALDLFILDELEQIQSLAPVLLGTELEVRKVKQQLTISGGNLEAAGGEAMYKQHPLMLIQHRYRVGWWLQLEVLWNFLPVVLEQTLTVILQLRPQTFLLELPQGLHQMGLDGLLSEDEPARCSLS